MLFDESLNLLQTMVVLKGEFVAHFRLAHKQISGHFWIFFRTNGNSCPVMSSLVLTVFPGAYKRRVTVVMITSVCRLECGPKRKFVDREDLVKPYSIDNHIPSRTVLLQHAMALRGVLPEYPVPFVREGAVRPRPRGFDLCLLPA